jgi:hypothetical protein
LSCSNFSEARGETYDAAIYRENGYNDSKAITLGIIFINSAYSGRRRPTLIHHTLSEKDRKFTEQTKMQIYDTVEIRACPDGGHNKPTNMMQKCQNTGK